MELIGEERYIDPTPADLAVLVDALLERLPVGAVRLFLAHNAAQNCTASGLLDNLFLNDDRIALPAAVPPAEAADDEACEAEAEPEDETPQEPEADPTLFTALDNLLIRTIVRSIMGSALAPERGELKRVVLEFVTLNTDRVSSYHHLGLLGALYDDPPMPPVAGMNAERWRWFRFGRLLGFVRRGSAFALLAAVRERVDVTEELLADRVMGRDLFGPILRAVLPEDPALAARWLTTAHPAVVAWDLSILALAQQQARQLLAEGRPTEAVLLLDAIEPWSDDDDSPGEAPWAPMWVEVRCDLVACRRAANDFAGATALLEGLDDETMEPQSTPLVAVERGLVAGRFGHLSHVQFPRSEDERLSMAERLGAGRDHFAAALAVDPGNPVAAFCLGVLALVEGELRDAASLLERVEAAAGAHPVLASFVPAIRFHRGLAALQMLQPGVDGPALKAVSDAIADGYVPPTRELTDVCIALQAVGSVHSGTFAARAVGLAAEPTALVPIVSELARALDPHAVDAARTLGRDDRLTAAARFECLSAGLSGAALLGCRPLVEDLADGLDDLVAGACDDALDKAWELLLAGDGHLRAVLGATAAELARVPILRRLGNEEAARVVLEKLFWRALNGDLAPYQPDDLLALLDEAGADDEVMGRFTARLDCGSSAGPARTGRVTDPLAVATPVRLVFVGGNPTQHQWRAGIDAELAARSGGRVKVMWSEGFSPDWSKILRRAKADLATAHALVLMPYVRTNLGRHLRREVSERELPWIPCTGKGRDSLVRAIERAVEVVTRAAA
jgi:hypothetical protein